MDGASALSTFIYLTLPHLARPITVVILIETIFLLTVFAEIFVTTGGGPGLADHQYRIPDLLAGADPVRRRQRLRRRTGRGRDRQYRGLLPGADRRAESGGVSDGTQGDGKTRMGVHGCRVVVRISDFPADPVDGADELQDRARGVLDAAKIPVVSLDHGELRDGAGAQRLRSSCAQFDHHCRRIDADRDDHRYSGGVVDGVRADQAHQGRPALDALDQDDAVGRRAGSDLSDLSGISGCSIRAPVSS